MAGSIILSLLLTLATVQDTGTLRVRVALTDASGAATPLPRILLLVSNNPATDEPRRVRTAADGTIELKLAPGSYTVELDEPIAFRGKAFTWTQIVEVRDGRETVLDLTADNAEAADGARRSVDSAAILNQWRDSVVEIWTPTNHGAGFVIDAAEGLIATSHHAINGASSVEVELTTGKQRIKVPGQVIVSERDPGAAVVRIDPRTLGPIRAIDLGCKGEAAAPINYKDVVISITASMLASKEVTDGAVKSATPKAIFSDLRIGNDSEGGPVFAESGALLGISAIDTGSREDQRRWNEAWVVPVERACTVAATAAAKIAGAKAPGIQHLPLDPPAPALVAGTIAVNNPKAPEPQKLSSHDFDITLLTPKLARTIEPGAFGLRTDFGTWSEYIRDAGQVLLVRVSPQFEEATWKLLARGYAALQGVYLNPFKGFTANFLRMKAYCGDVEVAPIHPFIIEHEVQGRSPIREGLYVFEPGAFGPGCSSIRFSMFSEKDPERADTKVIEAKLFEQLTKP